jgi:hypothetical protein
MGSAISVVVTPSARKTFTPHELAAAYWDFTERGPQFLNAETGLGTAAYKFGTRVLMVYQESETSLVVLSSLNLVEDTCSMPARVPRRSRKVSGSEKKPCAPSQEDDADRVSNLNSRNFAC